MSGREITASNDPKLVAARVFVGTLNTDNMTAQELKDRFAVYGRVLGVSLLKGYGFVQFEFETEAMVACQRENGQLFKGSRIDVKPANDRRRSTEAYNPNEPPAKRYADGNYYQSRDYYEERAGSQSYGGAVGGAPYDDRAPIRRDGYDDRGYDSRPGGGSFDDRGGPAASDNPLPVPKRNEVGVDRPFDAVIIVTNKALKLYAEQVERKLIELNLTVDVIFLIQEDALERVIDDMIRRGLLYIVVLQSQHEKYRSITVFLLHGSSPQEHRNMPLEDALSLLAKNFSSYVSSLRIGSEQPSMGFLLNLLADGKHLSIEELNRIIKHLSDRRDKLIIDEGGTLPPKGPSDATIGYSQQQPSTVGAPTALSSLSGSSKSIADLQQRVSSIIGSNAAATKVVPPIVSQSAPQPFSSTALTNLLSGSGSQDLKNALAELQKNPALAKFLNQPR